MVTSLDPVTFDIQNDAIGRLTEERFRGSTRSSDPQAED